MMTTTSKRTNSHTTNLNSSQMNLSSLWESGRRFIWESQIQKIVLILTLKPRTDDQVFLDKFLGSFPCSCVRWTSFFPNNFPSQVLIARVYNWTSFPWLKAPHRRPSFPWQVLFAHVYDINWQVFPWQGALSKSWHDQIRIFLCVCNSSKTQPRPVAKNATPSPLVRIELTTPRIYTFFRSISEMSK